MPHQLARHNTNFRSEKSRNGSLSVDFTCACALEIESFQSTFITSGLSGFDHSLGEWLLDYSRATEASTMKFLQFFKRRRRGEEKILAKKKSGGDVTSSTAGDETSSTESRDDSVATAVVALPVWSAGAYRSFVSRSF